MFTRVESHQTRVNQVVGPGGRTTWFTRVKIPTNQGVRATHQFAQQVFFGERFASKRVLALTLYGFVEKKKRLFCFVLCLGGLGFLQHYPEELVLGCVTP